MLAVDLEMREEAGDEDEVERPVARDLVRDVDLAAPRVADPGHLTPEYRKQSVVWSSTMPTVCMKAYTIVGPMKRKPRFFRSFESAFESGVSAGSSASERQAFTIGFPSTNAHRYASKLPCSCCASSTRRAFST